MPQSASLGGGIVDTAAAGRLTGEADALMSQMHDLSQMTTPPAHDLCAGGNGG